MSRMFVSSARTRVLIAWVGPVKCTSVSLPCSVLEPRTSRVS